MRKNPFLSILSAVLVIAGIAIIGVSVAQKVEMKANSGSYVLPELVFQKKMTTKTTSPAVPEPVKRGDLLGTITIPSLHSVIPIYEGTEDSELKHGVGHFIGSVLPGVKDNSVLAGHRDSVFSQLGRLKLGELLIVRTVDGRFIYKISRFRIVDGNDRTVIVPTKTAVLTLSTCYPFRFFGNAPQRYIVSANLVKTTHNI